MPDQNNIEVAPNPNVRNFPKISDSRVANDSTIAKNGNRMQDLVPHIIMHITTIGVFVAFLAILWYSIDSQMSNISTDIRELRVDTKKLDSRLDSIDKDIVSIKKDVDSIKSKM